jgi:mitotic spindle assembly checkpoint protein MAD2
MLKTITRLVLAITSKETLETVERWQFDIITEDEGESSVGAAAGTGEHPSAFCIIRPIGTDVVYYHVVPIHAAPSTGSKPKEKTEKEVQAEIREIMKQITASVTFLPILEEECKAAGSG